jgi:PelA/Pel-15E family pectate lyase
VSAAAHLLPVLFLAPVVSAAVIGTNTPALPVSVERIAALPVKVRPAWQRYWEQSQQKLRADQNLLQKEMRAHNLKQSLLAPSGRHARSIPLDRPAAWYGSDEARRIADFVVSFQTPAGGWSKNLDFAQHRRAPGEAFAPDNRSLYLGELDFDAPHAGPWNYVGTFDNGATTTQLRYLAKVIAATGPAGSAAYRSSFLRGLDYIFNAQYPNGGWPQVWPLQGGYHDAITFNDGAMINLLALLRDAAAATNEFAFVPQQYRRQATDSLQRGLDCIVASQIVVNGRRTAWGQQHDALTLEPASARNYEMPALVAPESAGILTFLMELPRPGPQIVAAVHAGAAWLEKTKIMDVAFRRDGDLGRRLVSAPGHGPLWSRFYEIGTDRPIFGDRDKTIHDDVNEISLERRNGYSWYTDAPRGALERYEKWTRR